MRHGEEFGVETANEYERQADNFMNEPLGSGVLECVRADGCVVRFDPATSIFGVRSQTGRILTFMVVRPLRSSTQTPLEYFRRNCS